MPEAEAADELAADLALLEDAAREGGRIALRYFRQNPEVWFKAGDSPVSEADFAVDRFLFEALSAARPDYGWLSEETADSPERLERQRTFVVDPIDGTRAFVAGKATWCVSVAVVERGRSLAGVLDCPALGETFVATAGGGAALNGKGIAVRRPEEVIRATGPKDFLAHLPQFWQGRVERMPHVPSLAYRIAMIAKGALDATFVRSGSHDWDLAAADLILAEAGGRLAGADGSPPRYAVSADPHQGPLVAGSMAGSGALLGAAVAALSGWEQGTGRG